MVRVDARRTTRVVGSAPWAGVLALTTGFQVVRREPVDVVVFAGALLLVVLDVLLPDGLRALRSHRLLASRPPRWLLLALALAVGAVLVRAPRHGVVSIVTVAMLGAVVTALALVGGAGGAGHRPGGPPADPPPTRARTRWTAWVWAGVVVTAGVVEATSFVLGRLGVTDGTTMPSISDLLDPLLDEPGWHALFVALWLATGVALLRRGRWSQEDPWASSR